MEKLEFLIEDSMNLELKAWKIDITGACHYRIQINDVQKKHKKILDILFKGWRQSGYGWNNFSKNEIYLFSKDFSSQESWLNWAKKCPIKLVEIKFRNGEEKHIQHSCKTRKKRE